MHVPQELIHICEGVVATDPWALLFGFLIYSESEVIIMTNTLFVGIDVSKKSNSVRLIDYAGDTLSLFRVPNNQDGAAKLLEKLKDVMLHTDFSSVTIGMESTSIYADHLAVFLRSDSFLKSGISRSTF